MYIHIYITYIHTYMYTICVLQAMCSNANACVARHACAAHMQTQDTNVHANTRHECCKAYAQALVSHDVHAATLVTCRLRVTALTAIAPSIHPR